jgi:hypothetical protein
MVLRVPAGRCALLLALVAAWSGCRLDVSGAGEAGPIISSVGAGGGGAQGVGGATVTSGAGAASAGAGGSSSVSAGSASTGAGTGGSGGAPECADCEVPEGMSSWSGAYTCSQGLTKLDLTIHRNATTNGLAAVFSFSPHPANPGGSSGSFSMGGTYDPSAQAVDLDQVAWIDEPPGYSMVDLTGQFDPAMQRISGEVQFSGCTTFEVQKD